MAKGITEEQYAAAEKLHLSRGTISQRISQGYSIEDALTLPLGYRRPKKDEEPLLSRHDRLIAKINGVSIGCVRGRMNSGYTKEQALQRTIVRGSQNRMETAQ